MLSEFITASVERVAKSEGFVDYKIETTAGSKNGDNFLGVVTAVTVTGMRRMINGAIESDALHLICKAPPLSEIRKKNWKSKLVFEREIYIYTKLLPAFDRFQREKGLNESDLFLAYPKVYACDVDDANDMYTLIMEDLTMKNFKMWPKSELISLDHELLVLRELAKFHAISFAMENQRPNEFAEFKRLTDLTYGVIINGSLKHHFDKVIERTAKQMQNRKHAEILQRFRKSYTKSVERLLLGEISTEFAVIRHGDCWNNNFMFEYDGASGGDQPSKLVGINFLDWQLAHYCSPAVDVLYNIFTSTDKAFRDQHYATLLDTYYSSLSDMMRKLGSDPQQLYTFQDFKRQLAAFSEYALLYAPIILSIRMAQAEDFENLDVYAEHLENGVDIDLMREFDEKTQTAYSKLINDAVTDLVNYGYIS